MKKIKRGLNLPISGEPEQVVGDGNSPHTVAVVGECYVGMKPTMAVKTGDKVKLGQLLFTDKKKPRVRYTSPGSGKVVEINRGHKRKLLSVVIALEGSGQVAFEPVAKEKLANLGREKIVGRLLDSGSWVALRARPFSSVADPDSVPHAIFVTAMDTNPLAPSIETILAGQEEDFSNGLMVLSKLTEGKLYLCKSPGARISATGPTNLVVEEFSGPHPAGLAGTHIHFLDPVGRTKTVWHINAQDVAAIGSLFTTGKIEVARVVALAGPAVKNPRLLRTRIGASLSDLTDGELKDGENRVISGSVFSGHTANDERAYLGRYHQQVSVLAENRKKEFLGWLSPGLKLHSVKKMILSSLLPTKKLDLTTSTNGGVRSLVPIGSYEKIMPLDILPTQLLRALAVDDVEDAEQLGCLELDEEDLALCTYVCPAKVEHGPALRRNLTLIEKEG